MMKEKERREKKISSFFSEVEGGWPGFGPTPPDGHRKRVNFH